MRIWSLLLTSFVVLALAGCKDQPPAPKAAEQEHSKHHDHAAHMAAAEKEAAQNEVDEPAGPSIETGSFLLAVAPAQPKYEVGKGGQVEIALEGRGEWHVNQEYPIRIDITSTPGLGLPKSELVKDDAAEFGDVKARFVASVEPKQKGEQEVTCDVSFAMCTEENCILERRTVAMKLEVQ
mgnify:FL=1